MGFLPKWRADIMLETIGLEFAFCVNLVQNIVMQATKTRAAAIKGFDQLVAQLGGDYREVARKAGLDLDEITDPDALIASSVVKTAASKYSNSLLRQSGNCYMPSLINSGVPH